MTVHRWIDYYVPARRSVSGDISSEDQRHVAREIVAAPTPSAEQQRRIALAMMDDNYRYPPLPDAHYCDMLARMNDDSDTRPVIGWLLIALAIMALAVWVLV